MDNPSSKGRKRYCRIPSCELNKGTENKDTPFFSLPSDIAERKEWILAIRAHEPKWTTINRLSRICNLHFDPQDIETKQRGGETIYSLKPGTVPKYFAARDPLALNVTNHNEEIKVEPTNDLQGGEQLVEIIANDDPVISKNLPRKEYCARCINTDDKVQELKSKLQILENEVKDQNTEIRSLLKLLQYFKTFEPASGLPKTENCTICNEKLSIDELYTHLCKKDETLIKCEYCSRTFEATIKLIEHLEFDHDEKRLYRCQRCWHNCEMILLLEYHLSEHTICSQKSKQTNEMEKPFICEICAKRFPKKNYLQLHCISHSNEKPFLCSECGKRFKTARILFDHQAGHRGFKCPDCPRTFTQRNNLTNHRDLHSNVKYICDICQAEFKTRLNHRNHMRKHRLTDESIDKQHKCEYCPKKFRRKYHLTRHIRVSHIGEKCYACEYCDLAFVEKRNLIRHLRKHLGNDIYECEECAKKFRLHKNLQNHLLNHKFQKEASNAEQSVE